MSESMSAAAEAIVVAEAAEHIASGSMVDALVAIVDRALANTDEPGSMDAHIVTLVDRVEGGGDPPPPTPVAPVWDDAKIAALWNPWAHFTVDGTTHYTFDLTTLLNDDVYPAPTFVVDFGQALFGMTMTPQGVIEGMVGTPFNDTTQRQLIASNDAGSESKLLTFIRGTG